MAARTSRRTDAGRPPASTSTKEATPAATETAGTRSAASSNGTRDTSVLGGAAADLGNTYGMTGLQASGEVGFLLGRVELLEGDDEDVARRRYEGLLPVLLESDRAFVLDRPAEVALSVYAIFF